MSRLIPLLVFTFACLASAPAALAEGERRSETKNVGAARLMSVGECRIAKGYNLNNAYRYYEYSVKVCQPTETVELEKQGKWFSARWVQVGPPKPGHKVESRTQGFRKPGTDGADDLGSLAVLLARCQHGRNKDLGELQRDGGETSSCP